MKSDLLHKCVDQLSRQAQVEAGLRALDGAEKNKTGMALALSEELLLPIWWTDKIDPGLTESLSQESNLRFVLAAEYITPKTAAQLRQLGIQYMDTAGNAYISAPGIHIVISGRPKPKPIKSTATPPSDGKTGKAFQATGLKVIYALINESKLANASMRALAEASGVSLGSVNGIHKDLIAHRFLKKTSSGIRLMNKDKLAQRWAELYPYAIRQKLLFGRYTCENNDWWESIVPGERIQVGGEAAAYQLSNYLTPKDGLIYAHRDALPSLMKKLRLRKLKEGEQAQISIDVYEAFWRMDGSESLTAPPLVVYSDLIATDHPRCIDAAERLWNDYLR